MPATSALAHGLGLLAVLVLAVGVPLWAAAEFGALGLPKNDDWAFARVALHLAQTGDLRLVGWGVMGMVGHVAWAQPWLALFGERVAVLNTAQAVASAVGLVATYTVARAHLPGWRALLVAAIVGAAPGYALASVTFMTDTTAYAAQMVCLALGTAALRHEGAAARRLLAGSLLVGLLAVTVREVAVVAPAAVLLGQALRGRRDPEESGRATAVAACMGLVAVVAFVLWRRSLPFDQALVGGAGPANAPLYAARAWFTAALALAPALVLSGAGAGLRRGGPAVAVAVADAVVIGLAVLGRNVVAGADATLFSGSALSQRGSLGSSVALGERPVLFGDMLWAIILVAGLIAGAVLAVRVVTRLAVRSRWRPGLPVLGPERAVILVFTLGSIAAAGSYAVIGGALFDRYLWPSVAGAAVLLLARPPATPRPEAWRRFAAGASLAGLTVLALAVTVEEYSYDAARWQAGQASVARGLAPTEVDAGFEWAGWHDDGVALRDEPHRISAPHPTYLLYFPGVGNCETVAPSRLDDEKLRLVDRHTYTAGPLIGERTLYTYRNDFACGLAPAPGRSGTGG